MLLVVFIIFLVRRMRVKFTWFSLAVAASMALSGCQTYKYAHQLKLVSLSDDFHESESIGNVRGVDCQSFIFGYPTGPEPSLDRALENAQNQSGSNRVRYITDVTTDSEGFDSFLYKKECLVVKGKGYK
jgi:hypothetical protein